jgi:endonuclease V-like protein UPF0215 family
MNFQRISRLKLLLMVLAATILLAGSAMAQEIENSAFDDGPNVAAFDQHASVQGAISRAASVVDAHSAKPMAVGMTSATVQADLAQTPSMNAWLSASLLICIALIAVYALVEAKRAKRNLQSRSNNQIRA